jgi:uncharacterized membrane protein (UPF0127 family)
VLALLIAACERGNDVNGDADDSASAYTPPAPASFRYDSAVVRIATAADTLRVRVEVAERDDQLVYGLMERTSLDDDAGMVFLYDDVQGAESGFWMYRTRIPLDIAFFDSAGRIVAIRQMEPCPSPDPDRCPPYAPGYPYTGALEVNHGWFARHGVTVGDHIALER